MVIFIIPILPGLHAQTTWIIISALINTKKAWKKTLNAFHYFPAIHQDRISDKVNSVAERVELIFWVLKEERIEK